MFKRLDLFRNSLAFYCFETFLIKSQFFICAVNILKLFTSKHKLKSNLFRRVVFDFNFGHFISSLLFEVDCILSLGRTRVKKIEVAE